MSDQPSNDAFANGQEQMPPGPLVMQLQFIKDLSFEVPNAPQIFRELREAPKMDIALDVQARPLEEGGNVYEVSLVIRADARAPGEGGEQTAFIAELVYCGIFTVNVEPQVLEPVLLVECPRLLFPFARNILADVTRDGGFPPVMLTPIDFVALWQNRRAAAEQAGEGVVGNA